MHLKIRTMKPVRCREIDGDRQTRGWYILAESYALEKMPDGNVFKSPIIVVSYGVFHGPSTTKFQITLSKDAGLTDEQKKPSRSGITKTLKGCGAFKRLIMQGLRLGQPKPGNLTFKKERPII